MVLIFSFLLCVFLLALSKTEDYDAWLHLGFGRIIWELKGLPAHEPFIYPLVNEPFLYSSWLFGLIYYITYLISGVSGIILLKAATITVGFFILIKDSLRPYKNYTVTFAVMAAAVIAAHHRFVERPDTFLMIFLAFSIFSLRAFVCDNNRYLYALPFVHMLWANTHSSITLMFIPFLAFLVGGIVQGYVGRRWQTEAVVLTRRQLKTILFTFIASFAASLVNPYFLGQYGYGTQILASDWYKQQIMELGSPTWQTEPFFFIMAAAVGISFLLNARRLSFIDLFLAIPFMVLPFSARRFIFVFVIATAPVIARNVSAFVSSSRTVNTLLGKKALAVLAASLIAVYCAVFLSGTEGSRNFGFGFNNRFMPEGALQFMDKRAIEGKVFNTFHWGQYITWRDFPRRAAFVDGRGYLSKELSEKRNEALTSPATLDELYDKYGFESVLIEYPIGLNSLLALSYDSDFALPDPGWALVYWDDLSLLYLKRGKGYDHVIKTDEYRYIKPANNIAGIEPYLADKEFLGNVIRELKRNIDETGSSKAHALLGFVCNRSGLYREAIDSLSAVISNPLSPSSALAYKETGYAYYHLGDREKALHYYRKALALEDDADTYYSMGVILDGKGEFREAAKYFSNALKRNRTFLNAYMALITTYHRLGMEEEAGSTTQQYEKAKLRVEAERQYEQGFTYFRMGMIDKAYEHQRRVLELDPDFANAHYVLGLIAVMAGDTETAKNHWNEYLRLDPKGLFAKKAREKLAALGKQH